MGAVGRAAEVVAIAPAEVLGTDVRGTGDRGTVTVEAALALCSLVVVLALMLAGVSAVAAQLRCVDAAREAARLTARGEQDRGEDLARRLAPRGAVVQVNVLGDEVTARVSADPVAGLLPGIDIGAQAVAVLEPGLGSLEPGLGSLEPELGSLEPGLVKSEPELGS